MQLLIEIDIAQPLPDELLIEKPDGKIHKQEIDYEWTPSFCQDCNQFGHDTGGCKNDQKQGEKGPVKQTKRRRRKQTRPTWQAMAEEGTGKESSKTIQVGSSTIVEAPTMTKNPPLMRLRSPDG
ncbi:uncharacterized protein LOC132042259 [Lycium ferocissimum]|uniref:uncharacterized protein LOC132042259 n=1 Tax=Lycium ferocissimum TaxID=112874 RepID=UPI002814BD53|nr:uncharacterized protein LOC132042259 [Lycium ferocissimum]